MLLISAATLGLLATMTQTSRLRPRGRYPLFIAAAMLTLGLAGLAAAIAWGGPHDLPPLSSINNPFKGVDYSGVPPAQRYTARDGTSLAWHGYSPSPATAATPQRRVVLVHGSSARGQSNHVLAQALAAEGYAVASLDMRGHGASGPRGQAAYIGQMEDDIEDFLRAVPHAGPQTLMGFSAGGGFALRFAGSARQDLFDRYVLLSPFLHHNAPTSRPDSGGWVSVGLPRMVAITLLNQIGITRWNHLPVLSFALNDVARELLTPRYSYTVATNFRPHDDYQADIRNARGTVCIVAGQDDELFYADRFADLFAQAGKPVPVTLVPGVNHMGLTLDAQAVATVARHSCPA
ncbi:alpha/beta fold hydrolase [Acidovorax sp. JMULE5]|uniref:alpha/beta hydrolase n=1 Tax=Acidovorax sp. JMULE5 TaxID=2518343 RepID=UPI00159F90B7|nr:alpha/beta fold hydrolase [Acidovorax sp. JMULE5]QLA83498.1 alpha/beta fold hydrolase [Acidovorax sp. JMULE5]